MTDSQKPRALWICGWIIHFTSRSISAVIRQLKMQNVLYSIHLPQILCDRLFAYAYVFYHFRKLLLMVCQKMGNYALVAYQLHYYTVQFKNTKSEEKQYARNPRNKKSNQPGTKTATDCHTHPVFLLFLLHLFFPKLPFIYYNLHFGFTSYFPLHFDIVAFIFKISLKYFQHILMTS